MPNNLVLYGRLQLSPSSIIQFAQWLARTGNLLGFELLKYQSAPELMGVLYEDMEERAAGIYSLAALFFEG